MVLLSPIRQVSGLKSRSPWSAHRRDEMAITLHAFALISEVPKERFANRRSLISGWPLGSVLRPRQGASTREPVESRGSSRSRTSGSEGDASPHRP